MSKIRVLADHVANQIAAGEVVERPMSVAKELVENAIDAGAGRLQIDIEAGGRKLIRVADDGEGMTRDDALLAFERHATSKISNAEDLFTISTLGFRGEALASIASIARVELLTSVEDAASATRVTVEGGRMRDVAPAARPRGTTVAVRELFFNVPARRKFLRSEATESFHLNNLITHYALAHPEIAFTLTNNGREVLRAHPAIDLRERAYQIFGADFLTNLLELPGENTRPRPRTCAAMFPLRASVALRATRNIFRERPLCARSFDRPRVIGKLPRRIAARRFSGRADLSRRAARGC
ncbi:MAG: DNA mismatch repair endonuclease MutL [Pyrinomonadaceae bacterium]